MLVPLILAFVFRVITDKSNVQGLHSRLSFHGLVTQLAEASISVSSEE
jgi:hypothetical protein